MKNSFVIFLLATALTCSAAHKKLTLQKALDNRLVSAQARSLGGYQDYCMEMSFKNLGKDSLIVLVEAGRRLNSLEEKNQDILIIKEELITLKKGEERWIQVKGYCCQSKNHSPIRHAKYEVNTLADSNLVALARYLNENSFESHVIQQAVWAISDNAPTARIASSKDSLLNGLRYLVANLKHEPIPWYTMISKTHVFTSGAMETYPLYLKGKFEYSNPKLCYTTLHVLDSLGREVCSIVRQWTLQGEGTYDLNLSVKGLAKGKYTIELTDEQKKALARKEFEV